MPPGARSAPKPDAPDVDVIAALQEFTAYLESKSEWLSRSPDAQWPIQLAYQSLERRLAGRVGPRQPAHVTVGLLREPPRRGPPTTGRSSDRSAALTLQLAGVAVFLYWYTADPDHRSQAVALVERIGSNRYTSSGHVTGSVLLDERLSQLAGQPLDDPLRNTRDRLDEQWRMRASDDTPSADSPISMPCWRWPGWRIPWHRISAVVQ